MHGQNLLFNQPLAIRKDYLMSLLPGIILGYQNNSFEPVAEIEAKAQVAIQSQIDMHGDNEKFPVVFDIKGPIQKYTDWYHIGTQTMKNWLKSIDTHPSVSGIVLDIDSGGGMVSGTAELTDVIRGLSKPTIAYTSGYQCSAAQWIASAADYKMASPFADALGSMGVFLSYQDFSAMFEKWGAKIYEVYAPESSEKNKAIRELFKGNEKLYKKELSKIAQDFITTIKTNIPNIEDDGKVFKGATYSAQEALDIKLIDEVGTLEDALSKF